MNRKKKPQVAPLPSHVGPAPAPAAEDKQNNRWWEFYFVRYGMSTVVGAVMVYVLLSTNHAFRALLFLPDYGNIEMANIVLLGAYGLAFCYVASAPVLTFYASRFYLDGRDFEWKSVVDTWKGGSLFLTLFVVLCFACVASYLAIHHRLDAPAWLIVLIYLAFFALSFIQATFVRQIFMDAENYYSSYRKLAEKREMLGRNFTDSYRHLREHGNSFSIVLCEILLAIILYMGLFAGLPKLDDASSPDIIPLVTLNFGFILAIWTFPAAAVWLIGIRLERKMIDDPTI